MELREYQRYAVSALWSWFRANPEGAPILCLPTGAGKSVIAAEIARGVCSRGVDRRVLIVAHRKELLAQNHEKVQAAMPWGRCTLFSAGLGKRDGDGQVVVGGVQSIYNRMHELGRFDLCIIDECHLCPPNGKGMYRTLIEELQRSNPKVRFVGLSATPYRLGSGLLTDGGDIWTDIAHEVPMIELINSGFLSPMVGKIGKTKTNLSLITVRGGEYVASEMERAFNRLDIVEAALEEVVAWGAERKSWLIFASGIAHAENIVSVLKRVGVAAECVTGETPPLIRTGILDNFKAGKIRALVNVDVLSVGFDAPGIDFIAVMRATKSTALWVQMIGRGARISAGKSDCRVLDFGGNAELHGPIDKVRIKRRYDPVKEKDAIDVETIPVKACPECGAFMDISSMECAECGYVIVEVYRVRHEAEPGDAPIMSTEEKKVYTVPVMKVNYDRHVSKTSGKTMLRVDYHLELGSSAPVKMVKKYLCFPPDYSGWATLSAHQFWMNNAKDPTEDPPSDVDEAFRRVEELRTAKSIDIRHKEGSLWDVIKVNEWSDDDDGGYEDEDPTGMNF